MSEALEKARKSYVDPIKEAEAIRSLRQALECIGEGEDAQLLLDMIEGETSFCEAIDRLLLAVVEDEALQQGALQAADALKVRAGRLTQRAEITRGLIEQAMLAADLPKLERPSATLSMVHRPPKLEVAEEAEIPAEFWKLGDPKLDKKMLLAALKAGRTIPGACLSNSAPSLTIRMV